MPSFGSNAHLETTLLSQFILSMSNMKLAKYKNDNTSFSILLEAHNFISMYFDTTDVKEPILGI